MISGISHSNSGDNSKSRVVEFGPGGDKAEGNKRYKLPGYKINKPWGCNV